jgi:hypothetical protein
VDYQHYIENAKEHLGHLKRLVKTVNGCTRRGDKHIVVQYIPNPKQFEGGEFVSAFQFFYKDDIHLASIKKELGLEF